MQSYLLFALLFIYTPTILSQKEIKLDLIYEDDLLFLPISVGTPPQHFKAVIDTSTFHWLLLDIHTDIKTKTPFNKSLSTSFETSSDSNNQLVQILNFKGWDSLDYVNLSNQKILNEKVSFLLLDKVQFMDNFAFEAELGLGRLYSGSQVNVEQRYWNFNPKYSLIFSLYNNWIIPYKTFSIQFTSTFTPTITLGKDPEHNNSKYYYCLQMDEKDMNEYKNALLLNQWHCKFEGVYSSKGDLITNSSQYFVISSQNKYSIISNHIADPIYAYIQSYLNIKCMTMYTTLQGSNIFCRGNVLTEEMRRKWPDIYINLPNSKGEMFKLIISGKDLFVPYAIQEGSKSVEGFMTTLFNTRQLRAMFWGMNFVRHYDIVFDMESGSLGFGDYHHFDTKTLIETGDKRESMLINNIICVLIGVIVGLIGFFMYKYLRKWHKRRMMIAGKNKKFICDLNEVQQEWVEPIGTVMIKK